MSFGTVSEATPASLVNKMSINDQRSLIYSEQLPGFAKKPGDNGKFVSDLKGHEVRSYAEEAMRKRMARGEGYLPTPSYLDTRFTK